MTTNKYIFILIFQKIIDSHLIEFIYLIILT